VRPAMNVGQSVSRVGGAAQIKAMKTAVGTLKGDLAQFRELEAFASIGSDLDAVSQATLDRGYRLTELLKQGLNSPLPVEEQVVVLYAGTRGYLDKVPVSDVRRFESELLDLFRTQNRGLLEDVRTKGTLDEDALKAALEHFLSIFVSTDGAGPEPDAEAQADAETTLAGGAAEGLLPEEQIDRPDEDEA
jgi:F-type H+-transporting ATPase subunit alpha